MTGECGCKCRQVCTRTKSATTISTKPTALDKSFELLMKNMGTMFHETDIFWCRVTTLTILDWSLEHVGKLGFVAKVIGSHPVHHAPVFHKIVLKRIARHNNPPSSTNLFQSLRNR